MVDQKIQRPPFGSVFVRNTCPPVLSGEAQWEQREDAHAVQSQHSYGPTPPASGRQGSSIHHAMLKRKKQNAYHDSLQSNPQIEPKAN